MNPKQYMFLQCIQCIQFIKNEQMPPQSFFNNQTFCLSVFNAFLPCLIYSTSPCHANSPGSNTWTCLAKQRQQKHILYNKLKYPHPKLSIANSRTLLIAEVTRICRFTRTCTHFTQCLCTQTHVNQYTDKAHTNKKENKTGRIKLPLSFSKLIGC